MQRKFTALVLSIAAVAAIGQTPPANCNTAGGFPCLKNSWTAASCKSTVTNGGANGSQDGGPCVVGILRCKGNASNCPASSLPSQSGPTIVGNSLWTVVSPNFAQTTFDATEYDTGVTFSSTYQYALTAAYLSFYSNPPSGGGIWGAYSSIFQGTVGPATQAPLGIPATPQAGTSTPQ